MGDSMIYENIKKKSKELFILFSVMVIIVIIRLFYVSVIQHDYLNNKANDLWVRSFMIQASRGNIYDCNGEIIATNISKTSMIAVPMQIKDQLKISKQLSTILNIEENELLNKLNKKVSMVIIKRQLDDEVVERVENLNIKGIYLIKDVVRYYPYDNYMSQTLGFVGIDNQGLAGIEMYYDNYLRGSNGSYDHYLDALGNSLNLPYKIQYPLPGNDLYLTVDKRLQDVLERELENAYLTYNPDNILALMVNPNNGEILGICSKPDFNCNNYKAYDYEVLYRNLPVFKTYEPGSTFKVITFAAALNEKLFDMNKDTYYDSGYEIVAGTRIKSWKKGGHGLQTFKEVLQNSSNPGFVEIGRRLGKDKLYEYVHKFGLTSKTNVDLLGESKGIMFSYENFNSLEQATVAFGQGISVTPIQLVYAISACVNGGYLYEPHILKYVCEPISKDIIYETSPKLVRKVIDDETSKKVLEALESVVALGGGKNAYIKGYRIGGKTGTAQKAIDGTYNSNQYILSFVGVLPIDKPQVVLYVAMDNPKKCIQYGGTTVAPIARKIMLDVIDLLQIEKVSEQLEKAKVYNDILYVSVPNFIGKEVKEIKDSHFKYEYIGEGNRVVSQLPRVGEIVEEGMKIVLFLGE